MMAILVRTCFEDGAITGIKIFLNLNWESLGVIRDITGNIK
jgi:SNF family Na+-dependent transporter